MSHSSQRHTRPTLAPRIRSVESRVPVPLPIICLERRAFQLATRQKLNETQPIENKAQLSFQIATKQHMLLGQKTHLRPERSGLSMGFSFISLHYRNRSELV